ncbi:MAG TPA: PAS domain-containing sensor histidine kinase [Coprothermobacter sp.]|jgi:signal transduction histidine kinase|nr:PAS domain-containing sensor histidine kinase [Coprothermobacter sp.]
MAGADLAILIVVLCALASVVVLFQTVSSHDRRSEENVAKDLLENLPVPVFVLDDDFRIIRYNGLFESLVGKTPLERFLYEVFRDHKVIDALQTCKKEGTASTPFYLTPSAEKRSYYMILKRTNGETIGTIEECTHGSTKEDVELYQKMLHELKTPLSSVRLMLELLEEEEDPLQRKDLTTRIIDEMDRLNQLTSDLALLIKMDRGLVDRMDKVNIVNLLSEVIWQMSVLADNKRVSIEAEIPSHSIFVEGSKSLLKSLFLNLLDNALKYSPEKTKITVTLQEQKENVLITVADEGEGIPEEQREKVFKDFYRATSKADGLGLGLGIALEVVKFHDGRLWLEPNEPHGLKVNVALRKA